jgi:GxxExxY protein
MEQDPETYAIIGAAMEVHRCLGRGFLEMVYQEALAVEFKDHDIPFEREKALPINYKDVILACPYKADFICFGRIIVELKAVQRLGPVEKAQVINYLRATDLTLALLINFGASSLEYERVVLGHNLR